MKSLNRKWTLVSALFVAVLVVGRLYLAVTPQEKQLENKLRNLPYHVNVPLSSLPILEGYDTVCMVDAYAVKSGKVQTDSLKRIFGDIDYSQFRDEIIRHYTDSYAPVGFYPVKNNRLLKPVRFALPYHTYIIAAKYTRGTKAKYFSISACYKTEDICLQKIAKDSYGEQPIEVGLCP